MSILSRSNKNKKVAASRGSKSHSPQENIWSALRATKEKAALTGDNLVIFPKMVEFYELARTYFEEKV